MQFVNFRADNLMDAFFRLPRVLFISSEFDKLSVEAKMLYCIMLDRMSLSDMNGWIDHRGQVYIYMGLFEIQRLLGCGHDKATRVLRELDTQHGIGLIERKNQGLGKPSRIYVKQILPASQEPLPHRAFPALCSAENPLSALRI